MWPNKLLLYRKKYGLSQKEVLERLEELTGKRSRAASYSDWESGKSKPQGKTLQALANLYKVEVSAIETDDIETDISEFVDSKQVKVDKIQFTVKGFEDRLQNIENLAAVEKEEAFDLLLDLHKEVFNRYKDIAPRFARLSSHVDIMKQAFNQITDIDK